MMGLFRRKPPCIHEWHILIESICESKPGITNASNISEDVTQGILFGKSEFILTCPKCGEIRKDIIYGKPKRSINP